MERLTYDFALGGNHCWQVKGADNLECREVCQCQEDKGCKDCPIAKAFDRLAAIEDILGDEYDLDELREMVQAKREGRCVVLPVSIGDTVYHITTCKNFSQVLDGTMYGTNGELGTATGLYCPCELAETCPFPCDDDGSFDCEKHKNALAIFEDVVTGILSDDMQDTLFLEYSGNAAFDDFGKTVFLTREDAEAALRREQE